MRADLIITFCFGVVGGAMSVVLLGKPAASQTAPSDPRVTAAILALAEDNVKLREAYASCGRSRAGLEEALKKERAK